LSQDEKEFIIINKKPIDNPKYVLEADPDEVEKVILEYKIKKIKGT
jgi:hypothetical protein